MSHPMAKLKSQVKYRVNWNFTDSTYVVKLVGDLGIFNKKALEYTQEPGYILI